MTGRHKIALGVGLVLLLLADARTHYRNTLSDLQAQTAPDAGVELAAASNIAWTLADA